MSASSELFLQERERHLIEVQDSYYKENFDFFKHPKAKHIRTIVTADEDMFKDDETHSVLLKRYIKAGKELRDYKFDKRHKHKK